MTQQARNLVRALRESAPQFMFLIHDRDTKFTTAFDEVFRSEGVEVIRSPVRAPRANAVMEQRWFGTLRREYLDGLLIVGRRHLLRVLRDYVDQLQRPPATSLVGSAITAPVDSPDATYGPRSGRGAAAGPARRSDP